ncbi:GNAT family N-acetyltransferase [Spirosoma pulveris]
MELLPIRPSLQENQPFIEHPDCKEALSMTIDYFNRIGYVPPWIGYFAQLENELVGSAGFKGAPGEGKVEIAYGTFPAYQRQGVGSQICYQLVQLALQTDPEIRITARTVEPDNYSARILKKNHFFCTGPVWDEEDGTVWIWEYQSTIPGNY